ncbi:hypothetical protein [Rhodopila sp.]|uniref:hypothetical protein n=1 Tax=Rhodopila sp. TaxID=2480087 RepID=UPI003D0FBCB0
MSELVNETTKQVRIFPETLDADDGYPSDEKIAQIRAANDIPNAAQWLIETFPKLVESLPCGFVEVRDDVNDFDRPIKIVSFSTGGWSGQEALIDAVEHGLVGLFYLWSWQRGGHYQFRVPAPQSTGHTTAPSLSKS